MTFSHPLLLLMLLLFLLFLLLLLLLLLFLLWLKLNLHRLTFDSLSSLLGDVIWEASVIDINPAKNRHVINQRGMICIGLTVREDVLKVFFEGTTYVRTLKNRLSERTSKKLASLNKIRPTRLLRFSNSFFYALVVSLCSPNCFFLPREEPVRRIIENEQVCLYDSWG